MIEFREDDTGSGGSTGGNSVTGDGWERPQIGMDAVQGPISQAGLDRSDEATVAVFPSQTSGVTFLKENNAWGFVQINQQPEYVTMYVSDDIQEVRCVARVREIVSATEAQPARTLDSYVGDQAEFGEGKKAVLFEPGSLYEVGDPIAYQSRVPYSLRYTDTVGYNDMKIFATPGCRNPSCDESRQYELGRFKQAETTDDSL